MSEFFSDSMIPDTHVLTYSIQEVVAAMQYVVADYTMGHREDVFLMLIAFERRLNSLEPSDAAAWNDWLRALWAVRGYGLSKKRIDPEVFVTFPSGIVSRAQVSLARNSQFEVAPRSELVTGGMTEIEGLELFRNETEKAYRTEKIDDMSELSTRLGSIAESD